MLKRLKCDWNDESFKPIIFLSYLLILFSQQSLAEGEYTCGDEVVFKSGKVFINFAVYDSSNGNDSPVHLFTVIQKSNKKHISFPEPSKLIVKFSNDSIIELTSFGEVIYEAEYINGVERSDTDIHYTGREYNPYDRDYYFRDLPPLLKTIFYTGRNYLLKDTDQLKLLMWSIVELQVEQSNGVIKKTKISKRHSKKVFKELQKSWQAIFLEE